MDELFIINEGGQLLYSWHSKIDTSAPLKDDDLIGGFLTAMNTFATFERGEDLKSLKLKESTIIFERNDEFKEKLMFVATTKNEELIELIHAIVHDVMEIFVQMYEEMLNKEFDGEVTRFRVFDDKIKMLLYSFGLDELEASVKYIDEVSELKSVIYLEPKGGHLFFVHAKQYVNKEKISFLVPLIINSSRLLYQNNLKDTIHWILINSVKNEIMLVELRERILIVKQYTLAKQLEERILALEFFKTTEKYIKKPKKIVNIFERLIWDSKIKQIFLVDLMGKILFSKIIDPTYDCKDYIPETISFLTSAKKVSEEVYTRPLFNASIGGRKNLTTICMNFNNIAIVLIGYIKDLNDFGTIQSICENILVQLE